MASQTTSSTAETSGTNAPAGSNLHHVIQADPEHSSQPLYVEMLLDQDWKNEEFLKLLDNYLDDRLKTINFHATVVQEYLNCCESLIQDAEGSSSRVNWEAPMPLNISHYQFLKGLCGVYREQMLKQDNLKSFQNKLSQKIHRVQFWIKFSNVAFFTATAVFGTAAAAHAISRKTAIGTVVASSVPILLGTIWRGTVSFLNKYMNGMKKYVEITGSMDFGARVTIDDLNRLYSSARRFETQMAESSDAGEERKKLVESFDQELKQNAALFRQDIESAREYTLESVKKHLDSMTRLSYGGT